MDSHCRVSITLGVLASLLCASLRGQESLSTLRGTVTDATGAIVSGAQITAVEIATDIKARVATSDSQGNYEMPGLKQGVYQLTVTMAGFKRFVADDIQLASSQVRRVDVALQVGGVDTTITVSEVAAAIETEQGKIGAEFTGARYKDIPIPGNRFSGTAPVLAVLPHVQPRAGGSTGGMTFGGQAFPQANMGMDGIKEETMNTQTVNMEAIGELKLVAGNNSAEFSRAGYFDTVTKRGANQYHGELSYYQQNSALYARGFFEKQKTRDLYHIFNLAGSGPIIRDKTFFYALWNGERVPGHTFLNTTVPTEAMRKGDFSQFLTLARPVAIKDPLTGQNFPGNIIPANRLSAVSLKVQDQFLPHANRGAADNLANNFDWVHPYPSDQFRADVVVTRIDHRLSEKNSFYGRLAAYWPRYITPANYPALATTSQRQSYSWAFVDTHVFTPTLINSFTFGGNKDGRDVGIQINGFNMPTGAKVVADLGLTGLSPRVPTLTGKGGGFPIMNITGFSSITAANGGRQDPHSFTFADAVTWSSPKHVVKFGGELRTYLDFNGLLVDGTFGQFTFDGSLTGNGYADFILGLPYSSQRVDPLLDRVRTSQELGLFINDTFKVTSRLNLDYGLRWDYFTATKFEDGLQYNWDQATNAIVIPQNVANKVSPLYPSNIKVVTGNVIPASEKTNFAPRVGFAYRFNERTVVRGGYGVYTEFLGKFVRAETGGPFQISETYFNTIQNGQPLLQFPNPFPSGAAAATIPTQSANGYPLETTNGYIQQFSLTLERQIRDVGFRLSYIGSRNIGINYSLNINKPAPSLTAFAASRRPYPQLVTINYPRDDGRQAYNSMTLEAKRRVGWITFDGYWTWAHNMINFLNLENPYNTPLWNRDDVTNRHRAVINSVFELPFGKGKRMMANAPRAVDAVLGGWKLAWVMVAQTGQFFSPSFSGSDPSNTNTSGGRPDRTCNGNRPADQRQLNRWFDGSCFAVPPAGRFGNSGLNILEGPGMQTHNVSLTKRFHLTERFALDYMVAASNVLNHPNFLSPGASNTNISVPGQVGVITSQHGRFGADRSGPRFVDMRLRLEF